VAVTRTRTSSVLFGHSYAGVVVERSHRMSHTTSIEFSGMGCRCRTKDKRFGVVPSGSVRVVWQDKVGKKRENLCLDRGHVGMLDSWLLAARVLLSMTPRTMEVRRYLKLLHQGLGLLVSQRRRQRSDEEQKHRVCQPAP
jgi:hypothetical protein